MVGFLAGTAFGLALAAAPAPAWAQEAETPGQVFFDCLSACPAMVVIPAGSFMMGLTGEEARDDGLRNEAGRRHRVTLQYAFAVGRHEVTYDEWDACVADGGCPREGRPRPRTNGPGHDEGWGRGQRPVINVSWDDAQQYVGWLSSRTGRRYRLLSESEWEYAARAGTTSLYSTGHTITANDANFVDTGHARTLPVGSFGPNAFGLYDMHGNVAEWVQDCRSLDYDGAATDGSVSTGGICSEHSVRGGSWYSRAKGLRSAVRSWRPNVGRVSNLGFRVARGL
tara:strand:- start:2188 stop:3033 length:846 start_codon:yes stop_codon:yes gene_type:complete